MHFKGGKGIAVTAPGVTVAIAYTHWIYLVIALLLFVIIVIITKYVSVGSLCVPAWALPVYALIFERDNRYFTLILIISFIFTNFLHLLCTEIDKTAYLQGQRTNYFQKNTNGGAWK